MDDLIVHITRRAMACEFEVQFPGDERDCATEAAIEALDIVESLEQRLSYFLPQSELSRINLLATDEAVDVSPEVFDILAVAMRVAAETDGAYDITATAFWEIWGFSKRKGRIPSQTEIEEARQRVGYQFVELDATRKTVRFLRKGIRLNLGSIGKGYALDVCSNHLYCRGINNYLLHGGQSSILARGYQSQSEKKSWEIGIRNPLQPAYRLTTVKLDNQAVGTSGGQFQGFRYAGRRYGHILDPRTGQPAQDMYSATVIAPTAALADALSTAFYVLGPEKSLDYCQSHPEIGAILVYPSKHDGKLCISTVGVGENTEKILFSTKK